MVFKRVDIRIILTHGRQEFNNFIFPQLLYAREAVTHSVRHVLKLWLGLAVINRFVNFASPVEQHPHCLSV